MNKSGIKYEKKKNSNTSFGSCIPNISAFHIRLANFVGGQSIQNFLDLK